MRSERRHALIIWVTSACLLGWGLPACAGSRPDPTNTATSQPPPSVAVPSQPPLSYQGSYYTNDRVGFSMTLPEGWSVAGPFDVRTEGLAYQLYALGTDAAADGGPGMSRVVVGDASSLMVEAFAQQQCSVCPPHPVEDVALDGRPAQRVLIGGGGVPFTVEWTFVRVGGQMIGFSLHDPETLEPLADVLASVRLP